MGAAAATAMLAATLLASAPAQASSKVTLTLWQNYGTEQNAVATKNLIAAFEKANPNITIKDVAQPGTNYFQLLQASQISGNGPDLAVMWTGVFDLQYQNLLVNLKGNVPAADLARMQNLQWTAPNFKAANGPLVMPL
ncbi:MAG TPA: extracellular solute-binding protein, partial [Acidimicrobiales bacterium]|nr:extracellular solute-binding protein [Acidimicrobiales bacterium]